jgi:hypothetical protein
MNSIILTEIDKIITERMDGRSLYNSIKFFFEVDKKGICGNISIVVSLLGEIFNRK